MTVNIHIDAFPPSEMAQRLEEVGVQKAKLDILSMFTLAILAGAFIGTGAIFATLVSTGLTDSGMGYGLVKLLSGLVFCLSSLTWGAFFFKNLFPVTIGNIISGSGCVGLVY